MKKTLVFALSASLLPVAAHAFTMPADTKITVPISKSKTPGEEVVVDEDVTDTVPEVETDERTVTEDQRIAALVAQQVAAELQKYEQQAQEETGKPVRRFKKRGYLTDRAWTLGSTAVVASLVGIIGTLGGVAIWQAVRKAPEPDQPPAGQLGQPAGAPVPGVGGAQVQPAGNVAAGGAVVLPIGGNGNGAVGSRPADVPVPNVGGGAVGSRPTDVPVPSVGGGAAGGQPANVPGADAALVPLAVPVQGWGSWTLQKARGAGNYVIEYLGARSG